MVVQGHLVCNVELRFLWSMDGFEGVSVGWETCSVRQLHFVVDSPVLGLLLKLVQRLAARVGIVPLLQSPVELVFGVTLEFWELSTMHSKDLVSELCGHIRDHFLHSAFF